MVYMKAITKMKFVNQTCTKITLESEAWRIACPNLFLKVGKIFTNTAYGPDMNRMNKFSWRGDTTYSIISISQLESKKTVWTNTRRTD